MKNAAILKERLTTLQGDHLIETRVFRADATDPREITAGLDGAQPDIVISDIPYGWHSNWSEESRALAEDADPIHRLLEALLPVLTTKAVVAIAAAKTSKIKHEHYRRLERFQVGKRQIVILAPGAA